MSIEKQETNNTQSSQKQNLIEKIRKGLLIIGRRISNYTKGVKDELNYVFYEKEKIREAYKELIIQLYNKIKNGDYTLTKNEEFWKCYEIKFDNNLYEEFYDKLQNEAGIPLEHINKYLKKGEMIEINAKPRAFDENSNNDFYESTIGNLYLSRDSKLILKIGNRKTTSSYEQSFYPEGENTTQIHTTFNMKKNPDYKKGILLIQEIDEFVDKHRKDEIETTRKENKSSIEFNITIDEINSILNKLEISLSELKNIIGTSGIEYIICETEDGNKDIGRLTLDNEGNLIYRIKTVNKNINKIKYINLAKEIFEKSLDKKGEGLHIVDPTILETCLKELNINRKDLSDIIENNKRIKDKVTTEVGIEKTYQYRLIYKEQKLYLEIEEIGNGRYGPLDPKV